MKVTLIIVRCEKVSDDGVVGAIKGPRVKVVASSASGSWSMQFPLDFAQHVHVGQSLTVDVAVG